MLWYKRLSRVTFVTFSANKPYVSIKEVATRKP